MICAHPGRESRESLSAVWGGTQLHDWYGVGDTGEIPDQGSDQEGMYVMEDAKYLDILGADNGKPMADGEVGDTVVTCLYKDDIPMPVADGVLPLGLQLIGHIGDELRLIAPAEAFQEATRWSPQLPAACRSWYLP